MRGFPARGGDGVWLLTCMLVTVVIQGVSAQDGSRADDPELSQAQRAHDHDMESPARWQFMHDGVAFLTVNRQAPPRGKTELVSQNWWMGMGRRPIGSTLLTLTGMLSAEALTMGGDGYSEIFQIGEAYMGRPITDRQHPHDFAMQVSASLRIPLADRTTLTLAGGPVGEATLGPVAFMHRQSAAENPFAPLNHHTMDSTHIAKGVVAAAVEHGPWALEGSAFHGREPDEHRWNLNDVGALDSWATRLWFRPGMRWAVQVSHGFLKDPEEVEPGDVRRTTATASWTRRRGSDFAAITAGYGRNDSEHGVFDAVFAEGTYRFGAQAVYGRIEGVDVESGLLLVGHASGDGAPRSRGTVGALTAGAIRDVLAPGGIAMGVGADVTLHAVPAGLRAAYGSAPVSFKVFLRLRPRSAGTHRMWDMTMTRPMSGMEPMAMQPD